MGKENRQAFARGEVWGIAEMNEGSQKEKTLIIKYAMEM